MRSLQEVSRPHLEGKEDPTVAYLPLASLLAEKWLEPTERAFRGLARVEVIDADKMDLPEMESVIRRADLAYIPDGNAFLRSHRLYASRLIPYLRQKVQRGLPVVAFGAGAVACGPNVLTSMDLNMVPTAHFDGLQATPFSIHAHYEEGVERDNWLAEYHTFHDNAVIMLEDGAYLKIEGKAAALVRGNAWCWRPGSEKERLTVGKSISAN
jgi:peptidase E